MHIQAYGMTASDACDDTPLIMRSQGSLKIAERYNQHEAMNTRNIFNNCSDLRLE